MKIFLILLTCLASPGLAQVEIARLPEDLAKKTISLNPEFLIYGKDEVKKDEKPDDKGELICVMNIELDGGKTMTFIEIYDQDEPKQVVSQFGEKYNLSNNAQSRLLEQVLS